MENNNLNDILEIKKETNMSDGDNMQSENNFFYEKVLRIIANLILAIGILLAIILFFTIGLDKSNHFGNTSYYFNMSGFIISISTLVGSFISWAFFHVTCNISEGINKLSKCGTKFKMEE